jgi:hypothetical protein
MAKMTTLKEFESIFPTIVEDLLAHAKQYGAPQMALDWYKAVRVRNIFLRMQLTLLESKRKHYRRKM